MTQQDSKHQNLRPEQLPLDFEARPKLEDEGVSAFEAKQERRRQRLLDRAERHRARAESSDAAANQIADMIPMGQPVLVGHHSEKADRNRRGRMHRLFDRAHEEHKTAEDLRRRAEAVGTAGISADDPAATGKLEAKGSELEAKRDTMKRANTHWKRHGTLEGFDELGAKDKAAALRGMQLMGADVPFPGYALRNIGARIRQAKARAEDISARDEAEPQELQGRGFRVFEDRDENRLVIQFEERQPEETCRMLHRAGFHWARSRGAWTRQLTPAAWVSAHSLAERLTEKSVPTPSPAEAPLQQAPPRTAPPNTVLRELRASAKEWWYHVELRKQGRLEEARERERGSMRSTLQEIRATLANDGWLSIGRGGATLHYSPNAHVEGLHPHHVRACIAAGIPTLDSTAMDIKDVYELSVRGPMAGFADSAFGPDLDGSLSTRQWRVIFDRYAAREGAVFHNYTPTPTHWHPLASSS